MALDQAVSTSTDYLAMLVGCEPEMAQLWQLCQIFFLEPKADRTATWVLPKLMNWARIFFDRDAVHSDYLELDHVNDIFWEDEDGCTKLFDLVRGMRQGSAASAATLHASATRRNWWRSQLSAFACLSEAPGVTLLAPSPLPHRCSGFC